MRCFGVKKENLPKELRDAVNLAEELHRMTETLYQYPPVGDFTDLEHRIRVSVKKLTLYKKWLEILITILSKIQPTPRDASVYLPFEELIVRLEDTASTTWEMRNTGISYPIMVDWQNMWHSIARNLGETALWAYRWTEGKSRPDDKVWWLRACMYWKTLVDRSQVLVHAGEKLPGLDDQETKSNRPDSYKKYDRFVLGVLGLLLRISVETRCRPPFRRV